MKKERFINFKANLVLAVMSVSSVLYCCNKSEYTKLMERELASGRRFDSLFMGLHLGMTRREFFEHCWDLNKRHIFTNSGTKVLYKFYDGIDTVVMKFYPDFVNDTIYQVKVNCQYLGWTPWIPQRQPDSLQMSLKRHFEKWYGPGFIKVRRDGIYNDFALVKVDGNRRLIVFRENETEEAALFTDLLAEKRMKKE